MRQLRTAGLAIALLALAGLATGCGSVPVAPAASGAQDAGAVVTSAGTGEAGAGIAGVGTAQAISVAAKERGAVLPAKPGANVKHADLMFGVSCVGTPCIAVGGWYYGTKNGEHTLVEMWTGKAWVVEPSPYGPKDQALGAVSCAAGTPTAGCIALGTPTLAGYGSHWRVVTAPNGMNAVSCTSATTCLAVGALASLHAPVFATWNGTTWHKGTMHAAPPQGQQVSVTIDGVSCTSANNCVAVGNYAYPLTAQPSPAYRDKTLAEQWNGHSWRLLPTVNVSHVNALAAVSCASADTCTAVGTNQGQFPLAERWNGSTWRVESMPTVSTVGYVQLSGVSCPAANFCVASGGYQTEPIAETWNGTKWRLTQLPEPPGGSTHGAQLSGVSCVSSRACVAVGTDYGIPGAFAERYAGGEWRLSAMRNPT